MSFYFCTDGAAAERVVLMVDRALRSAAPSEAMAKVNEKLSPEHGPRKNYPPQWRDLLGEK